MPKDEHHNTVLLWHVDGDIKRQSYQETWRTQSIAKKAESTSLSWLSRAHPCSGWISLGQEKTVTLANSQTGIMTSLCSCMRHRDSVGLIFINSQGKVEIDPWGVKRWGSHLSEGLRWHCCPTVCFAVPSSLLFNFCRRIHQSVSSLLSRPHPSSHSVWLRERREEEALHRHFRVVSKSPF